MTAREHERGTARRERAAASGGPGPGQCWVDWLEDHAARLEAGGGAAGRVAGSALRRLAAEARELGAGTPEEYERLAEEACDEEAAWDAAREAEWDDFVGRWSPGPGPDGGPGPGHPVDEPDPNRQCD